MMNQLLLVKKMKKAVFFLNKKQGPVALFMLKPFDADMDTGWQIIASAAGYDRLSTKAAIKHLLDILKTNLNQNILGSIIHVAVLKTKDPFVLAMNRTFKVRNAPKHIQSVSLSGIQIENALVFECPGM